MNEWCTEHPPHGLKNKTEVKLSKIRVDLYAIQYKNLSNVTLAYKPLITLTLSLG